MSQAPPKCPKDRSAAKWLEIDDEMKGRERYYWGWYCPSCNDQLGEIGVR